MITIEGLSKTYAGTGRLALNDIALQIPKGQYTAFSGAVAPAKYAYPLSQFTGAAHLGPHSGERTDITQLNKAALRDYRLRTGMIFSTSICCMPAPS